MATSLNNQANVFPGGGLVISLDFELFWGVRDKRALSSYRENLFGVRQAIPAMLQLFSDFGIHATWATVGFLFFETRDQLLDALPSKLPRYTNRALDPYPALEQIGRDETEDPFHFAPSLIDQIASTPHQEIGSHTFSHYYCLEPGQDVDSFTADLRAACLIAKKRRVTLSSLVFPRNQFNADYLQACASLGFRSFRGNVKSRIYEARGNEDETKLRRAVRLLDAYLPVTGSHGFDAPSVDTFGLCDVRASSFLRPYQRIASRLEPLRLERIVSDLRAAAKSAQLYHLWWHPHNFGRDTTENVAALKTVLSAFSGFRKEFGMQSFSMAGVADRVMGRA
jgi:peptidoglycan/xylan/chitin deacetylase (PgdA/CDA1 family)